MMCIFAINNLWDYVNKRKGSNGPCTTLSDLKLFNSSKHPFLVDWQNYR